MERKIRKENKKGYSNTTLVKVKLFIVFLNCSTITDSNTTLVKVKFNSIWCWKYVRNSNTTLVKVKFLLIQ